MKTIIKAAIEVDNIVNIDSEVMGNTSRRDYIKNAIARGHCIIVKVRAV
ncbi:hypothetical protein [Cytobacillus firmus]